MRPRYRKSTSRRYLLLMDVLFRIEQTIVDTESTGLLPPRPASLDDDALMDCYKELSHLHFELQKRKSRLLRPFQDKELRPHIEMLHKFRENFPSIFLLVSCLYDDAFLHVLFR